MDEYNKINDEIENKLSDEAKKEEIKIEINEKNNFKIKDIEENTV